jgi:hypothetical protein
VIDKESHIKIEIGSQSLDPIEIGIFDPYHSRVVSSGWFVDSRNFRDHEFFPIMPIKI